MFLLTVNSLIIDISVGITMGGLLGILFGWFVAYLDSWMSLGRSSEALKYVIKGGIAGLTGGLLIALTSGLIFSHFGNLTRSAIIGAVVNTIGMFFGRARNVRQMVLGIVFGALVGTGIGFLASKLVGIAFG